MKKTIALIVLLSTLTLMGIVIIAPIHAQDACIAIIEEQIDQTLHSCVDTERGYVCYGGTSVFSQPESLADVDNVQTDPLDKEAESYGVALMNVSANYPNAIGTKGVIYLLMGDVHMENAVPPAQVFDPVPPITVTVQQGANLRTRPSTIDTVLFSVDGGTVLLADGISSDGEWLRVVYDETPAWVFRSLVSGDGLDDLPTLSSDHRSIMQSFDLLTGENPQDGDCPYSPNTLIIQALDEQPAYLTVNGLDMYILKTVALRNIERPYSDFVNDDFWAARFPTFMQEDIPDDATCQFIQLSAIDGEAFLNNYKFSIPRGFRAHAFQCQNINDVGLIFETQWDRPEQITFSDLAQLKVLENLPDYTFREQVELVTMQEIASTTTQLNILPTPIPYVPPAQDNTDVVVQEEPVVVPAGSCTTMRLTSPQHTIPFGYVRFYWDPEAGADAYLINLYNPYMGLMSSGYVNAPETSARLDVTNRDFNQGADRTPVLFYEITAYQAGNVLCQIPPTPMPRAYDPDPDCPEDLWFTGTCEDVIANDR